MFKHLIVLAAAYSLLIKEFSTPVESKLICCEKIIKAIQIRRSPDLISVDQFKIYDSIASGNRGTVYAARRLGYLSLLALKAVYIPHAQDVEIGLGTGCDAIVDQHAERDALIYLNEKKCPWVVTLYGTFSEGSWAFFALELLPGGTYYDKIFNKINRKYQKPKLLSLAEVVVAIEAVHDLGYEHGDAVPQNFLIDKNGHLKLADFAQSKRLGEKTDDWKTISRSIFEPIFGLYGDYGDEDGNAVVLLLSKMENDEQLPKLKKLPFWQGINWKKVAQRAKAPYKSTRFNKKVKNPQNHEALFKFTAEERTIDAESFKGFNWGRAI